MRLVLSVFFNNDILARSPHKLLIFYHRAVTVTASKHPKSISFYFENRVTDEYSFLPGVDFTLNLYQSVHRASGPHLVFEPPSSHYWPHIVVLSVVVFADILARSPGKLLIFNRY